MQREREREEKDMRAKWNEILKKSDRAEKYHGSVPA